jgi:hypothetical protein
MGRAAARSVADGPTRRSRVPTNDALSTVFPEDAPSERQADHARHTRGINDAGAEHQSPIVGQRRGERCRPPLVRVGPRHLLERADDVIRLGPAASFLGEERRRAAGERSMDMDEIGCREVGIAAGDRGARRQWRVVDDGIPGRAVSGRPGRGSGEATLGRGCVVLVPVDRVIASRG